ncbi:MAG: hypothetical protein ACLRNQ_03855 [Flavonifractor plautii]
MLANKEKEQTITVGGTEYHPSYIQYKADTADNTYEFDVLKCDNGGVEFDSDYDFILDSNGNVIAYRPSEQGLYDYALVLDSGYEPGAFASDASGKIKVLLADGTEGVYTLNFSASAKNVGEQVADVLTTNSHTEKYSKNQGIQELKGFLGTSDSDNSATAPGRLLLRLVIPAPLSTRTLMRLVLLVSTTPTTRTAALLAMSSPTP